MSRLIALILTFILFTACNGINPSPLPVPIQPPEVDKTLLPVIEKPIATQPPGSGIVSPPDGTRAPGSGGPDQPYAPRPGDGSLQRGNIHLDSVQLLGLMSYPVQIVLSLTGNLPDPCHHLRVAINPPDEKKDILVEVYSVVDPDQACIMVLEPFDVGINLGAYPAGHYRVWVNGEKIGEFDA